MAVTRIPIPQWAATPQTDERLERSLAEVDLAVRTVNCLEDRGIFTVEDLLKCTAEELLEIPNFGGKTLDTVYEALAQIGFDRATAQPTDQPNLQVVSAPGDFALLSE